MPAVKEKTMRTVVLVDGSRPSLEGLASLLRSDGRPDELVLLYVAPSARQADLEQGERALEVARDTCKQLGPEVRVTPRLEIGEAVERTRIVAKEEGVDTVAMSRHDAGSFPYLDREAAGTKKLCEECVDYPVEVLN